MTLCEEQYGMVCKDEFASIHVKLDKLDEAIRGNGLCEKPGITVRLDRLEQNARRQARLTWMILGAGITALASGVVGWITG
jgi:hypothetical protein